MSNILFYIYWAFLNTWHDPTGLYYVQNMTGECCAGVYSIVLPCSRRSFPMLYVAFARRVKRPTSEANLRRSFTAPSVITVVSTHTHT